jgi:NAD(P)-dependent dehydrogenase (short-subunit alcohol dehydrogenase family)
MHSDAVMIVTGATNGIGLVTARELAHTGATVVLVGRNHQRIDDALAHIRSVAPNAKLGSFVADLSRISEVQLLAQHVINTYPRVDVMVNNAGAFFQSRQLSADGIEMTFALNHLAPFVLTNLLLNHMRASAPARIINVSSAAHQGAVIDFDDIQFAKKYNGWKAYAQSKLANLLFTYELADRLQDADIVVNALHPGFVNTGFAKDDTLFAKFFGVLQKYFAITPEKGAQTSIYLATNQDQSGVTGRYFVDSKPVPSSRASYDYTARRKLWEISAKLMNEHIRPS